MCCFNLIGYFHTQETRSTPRATTEEGRELGRWVYIAHAAIPAENVSRFNLCTWAHKEWIFLLEILSQSALRHTFDHSVLCPDT